MKDERLEMLSDKVRMGVPIDFKEAIEVIDYQMKLQQEQKNNSWVYKVRRFFGFEQ
jgi:DNA-binding transcriptional regulator/RsmH inhibitor MraZ